MSILLTGMAIFFAVHLLPLFRTARQSLIDKVGRSGYTGAFALISAVGLIAIIYGYGDLQIDGSANHVFWTPPVWMKHIVFLLMIPSFILIAAAYIPSRIRDKVKHPMLAAIKIWAFSHLLANGDLASIILFGAFLTYAVIDRISLKKRVAAGQPTLGLPATRSGGLAGDIAVITIGLAAYTFMLFYGHSWLIGIALVGY